MADTARNRACDTRDWLMRLLIAYPTSSPLNRSLILLGDNNTAAPARSSDVPDNRADVQELAVAGPNDICTGKSGMFPWNEKSSHGVKNITDQLIRVLKKSVHEVELQVKETSSNIKIVPISTARKESFVCYPGKSGLFLEVKLPKSPDNDEIINSLGFEPAPIPYDKSKGYRFKILLGTHPRLQEEKIADLARRVFVISQDKTSTVKEEVITGQISAKDSWNSVDLG